MLQFGSQPNFRLLRDLPFLVVPMQLPPVVLTDGSCVAIQAVPLLIAYKNASYILRVAVAPDLFGLQLPLICSE
jgi:hypothetical protein